jgi:HAD superfamily hydrolase (TIGR01549 family)
MKIVYSDLDGTLLDSSQCSVLSTQKTFSKFCRSIPSPEKIIERMGIPIEVTFPEMSEGLIHDQNWDEVSEFFRAEYRRNSETHISLFDGIASFLAGCTARHIPVLIVTSKKTEPAERDLRHLGVFEYIYEVIGSDKVDKYKPDPDPIFKARARFSDRVIAKEIMIGDADVDIKMGKAASVMTCAVAWGAHDQERLQRESPDFLASSVPLLADCIYNL